MVVCLIKLYYSLTNKMMNEHCKDFQAMSLRFTGMFAIWLKLMFQKFRGLGFLKGTILLKNHCLWLLANVVWFLQQMIIDMMPSFISSQHYQRKLDLLVLKIHY